MAAESLKHLLSTGALTERLERWNSEQALQAACPESPPPVIAGSVYSLGEGPCESYKFLLSQTQVCLP